MIRGRRASAASRAEQQDGARRQHVQQHDGDERPVVEDACVSSRPWTAPMLVVLKKAAAGEGPSSRAAGG
jgi:hypothetical protein